MRSLDIRMVAVCVCSLFVTCCTGCGNTGEGEARGSTNPRLLPGTYSAPLSGQDRGLWLLKIGTHTVSVEMPTEDGWYVDNRVKVMPGKLVLPDDPSCPDQATVVEGRYKSTPARATYRWAVRSKVLELKKIDDNCNPGARQLDLQTRWTQEKRGAVDVAFLKRPPEDTRPSPAGRYSARLSPDPASAGIWTLTFRSQRALLSDPDNKVRLSSTVHASSKDVVFSNDPECPASSNPVPGRYRWGSRDASLAFTKVADRCGSRRRVLQIAGVSWFK